MARGLPFRRVSSIMGGVPSIGFIGSEGEVNRHVNEVMCEAAGTRTGSKVGKAGADEVVERGAFRIVNRISRAAVSAI